jgi:hypothetical protein
MEPQEIKQSIKELQLDLDSVHTQLKLLTDENYVLRELLFLLVEGFDASVDEELSALEPPRDEMRACMDSFLLRLPIGEEKRRKDLRLVFKGFRTDN